MALGIKPSEEKMLIWIPDAGAIENIHAELTRIFENEEDPISPPGVKSHPLLESACSRPHTGAGAVDKYKTLEQKAAALVHSLTKNHAFHNGNKRTALVTLLTVLERNDRRFMGDVTDDTLFDMVVAVTADEFPNGQKLSPDDLVIELASWIRSRSESISAKASGMKTSDFLELCQKAGAVVKEASGARVVTHGQRRIKIGNDTRQLDGPVVKRYLKNLELSEQSGIGFDDFQQGAFAARSQIQRFMAALRRLAKT